MAVSDQKVELEKDDIEGILSKVESAQRMVHVVDVLIESERFGEIEDGATKLLNDAFVELIEVTETLEKVLERKDSNP